MRFFQPVSGTALLLDHIRFGRWRHPQGEEVVVCRRSLHTEIHCHGGCVAGAAIVDDLVGAGADYRTWQDWVVQRGTSALCVEAHRALVSALTERVALCLLDQYHGALATAVASVVDSLARGELSLAAHALHQLLQSSELGLRLTTPRRVVITGPPNVGKSCLINAIVGYQRALVHEQAGTTRDLLIAMTAIDGWPVELIDTAGIHESQDAIEREGMRQAMAASQAADLVIVVRDLSAPQTDAWLPPWPAPTTVIIGNKCDLLAPIEPAGQKIAPSGAGKTDLWVSAKTGEGLERLMSAIVTRFVPHPPRSGDAIVFTPRQRGIVERSIQALEEIDVDTALVTLRRMDDVDDLSAASHE